MRHGNNILDWSKDEINDIIDFYTATTTDSQLLSINSEKFYENKE